MDRLPDAFLISASLLAVSIVMAQQAARPRPLVIQEQGSIVQDDRAHSISLQQA